MRTFARPLCLQFRRDVSRDRRALPNSTGSAVTLKIVCLVLVAAATLGCVVGEYLPEVAAAESFVKCVDEEAPERDSLSSEPSLLFPLLFLAKIDDERAACTAALDATSVSKAPIPRAADVSVESQCLPRVPGPHDLCTYLS